MNAWSRTFSVVQTGCVSIWEGVTSVSTHLAHPIIREILPQGETDTPFFQIAYFYLADCSKSSSLFRCRFCLKNCPPNDLECALSPYALEYKLLSLPFGIAANQDLIRLVAYTQDGVVHPRTSFLVVDEDTTLPFALRDENLKGVLFTTRPLREPHTYRMKVRALSYSADGGIEYQTTFIVYIAVSAYPYWALYYTHSLRREGLLRGCAMNPSFNGLRTLSDILMVVS